MRIEFSVDCSLVQIQDAIQELQQLAAAIDPLKPLRTAEPPANLPAAEPPPPPAQQSTPAPAIPGTTSGPAGTPPTDSMSLAKLKETVNMSLGLDSSGLPWDSRINTKNGMKTAKGVFKQAPGLKKEFIAEVKAELKKFAGMLADPPAAGSPASPPAPPAASPPAPPAASPPAPPAASPPAPPAAGSPASPPAPPAAGPPMPTNYAEFVDLAIQRMTAGSLTRADIDSALQQVELFDMTQLASAPAEKLQYVIEACENAHTHRTWAGNTQA